jgi:hypothetical protein
LPHFDRQGLACAASRVGYETEKRAPLLLIAGENDHTFPAPLTRSAFRQYRQSKAVTGYEEFPADPTTASASRAGRTSPAAGERSELGMLDAHDLGRCRVQRDSEASSWEMGDDSAGH